jgi:hypothetical protein
MPWSVGSTSVSPSSIGGCGNVVESSSEGSFVDDHSFSPPLSVDRNSEPAGSVAGSFMSSLLFGGAGVKKEEKKRGFVSKEKQLEKLRAKLEEEGKHRQQVRGCGRCERGKELHL